MIAFLWSYFTITGIMGALSAEWWYSHPRSSAPRGGSITRFVWWILGAIWFWMLWPLLLIVLLHDVLCWKEEQQA